MATIESPSVGDVPPRQPISLVRQIMIGLVAGITVGAMLNHLPAERGWIIVNVLQPACDLFIKLMQMIVVPLVFTAMVLAISGNRSGVALGRLGVRTLGYFFGITVLAIVFGLVSADIFEPGSGTDFARLNPVSIHVSSTPASHGIRQFLVDIVPANIVNAMMEGKLLSTLFFAVMFGIGMNGLDAARRDPVIAVFRGVADTMIRVTAIVMTLSPIGVFGMIGVTVANFGFASLLPLGRLVVVIYVTIAVFSVVVLGLVARIASVSLFDLMRHIPGELVFACTTAGSAAVLPGLMRQLESFGLPPQLVAFVVPPPASDYLSVRRETGRE